jgi:hypothetical protein
MFDLEEHRSRRSFGGLENSFTLNLERSFPLEGEQAVRPYEGL